MAWVATAVIGSAVIGGVSSYFGAEAQKDAAESASQATLQGQRESIASQEKMYNQTREDQEPWRLAGENALGRIEETPDFSFTAKEFDEFSDPSYDWRMSEGLKAVDNSASSRGNLFSGAQAKAVQNYGQNMASQEFSNAYGRAKSTYDTNMNTDKSLAGVGQQANSINANAGQNMANNISSTAVNTGNSLANIAQNRGSAIANSYGDFAQGTNQAIGNGLLAYKTRTV